MKRFVEGHSIVRIRNGTARPKKSMSMLNEITNLQKFQMTCIAI